MHSPPAVPVQIHPATAEQLDAALPWALQAISAASRTEQLAWYQKELRSGRIPLAGLWVAQREDRLVGAQLAQKQPGRSSSVWLPGLAPGEPPQTARELLNACLAWLASQSVHIAQVVLETVSPSDATLLEEVGFRYLAELRYLVCLEIEFPQCRPAGPLEFEPYTPEQHGRLAQLVETTYEQTLDCPGLDDVRDVEDVLEGYRASGVFDRRHWLLVRHAGEDVGTLLLTDYPQQGNLELVYMGLVPRARGHAWGKQIVQYAQWLAREAGFPRLVVAVDAANRPAIAMYAACGFQVWDRRQVFLKVFS